MEVKRAAVLAVILTVVLFQPANSLMNNDRLRLLDLNADKQEYCTGETATITAVLQLPTDEPMNSLEFKWREGIDKPVISNNRYVYKDDNQEQDKKRYDISVTHHSSDRVTIIIVITNLALLDQRDLTLEVFNGSGKIENVSGRVTIWVRERDSDACTTVASSSVVGPSHPTTTMPNVMTPNQPTVPTREPKLDRTGATDTTTTIKSGKAAYQISTNTIFGTCAFILVVVLFILLCMCAMYRQNTKKCEDKNVKTLHLLELNSM